MNRIKLSQDNLKLCIEINYDNKDCILKTLYF